MPDHEHAGGQQRQILLPGRLERQRAEALVVEQVLDGDEAADEVADTGRRSRRSSAGGRCGARACGRPRDAGSPFRYAVRA